MSGRARWLLAVAIVVDITSKVIARLAPDALGRFAFRTPLGAIGFAPSVNAVLAFSLPVPNAWVWPIGWGVVLVLVGAFGRISHFTLPIADARAVALLPIIAGGISNLIDRTFLGGVTDYLALTDQFPAFNIADLLILGGILRWVWKNGSASS